MSLNFEHTTLGQRVLFGAGRAGAHLATHPSPPRPRPRCRRLQLRRRTRRAQQPARSPGRPAALKDYGFAETDIPEAVQLIPPAIPESNPRTVIKENPEELLRAVHGGGTPTSSLV
jgi:hypothetical protein